MAGRATITQIASRLGVAPSTVSRAFNEPRLLRPETVARVKAVADEMGYVANRHARALITGRSGAIGLIVPDITNPFFPSMIRFAQREAEALDLVVLVVETDSDPEQERSQIASLLAQTEGLIIASSRLPASELRHLAEDSRVVLLNNDTVGLARVLISSRIALAEGIRQLATQGIHRICYVGGPEQSWSEHERRDTVSETAQHLRLATTILQDQSGTYAEARRLIDRVIASGAEAVVAFDDVIAHGVMDGLDDHGLQVPHDVCVLGCDDALPIQTRPRLSTIRLQSEKAIQAAIRMLANSGSIVEEQRIEFPGELQLRETTRAPR